MEGYNVQLVWDDEAKVWMATSKDIPGLILEACRTGNYRIERRRKAGRFLFPL